MFLLQQNDIFRERTLNEPQNITRRFYQDITETEANKTENLKKKKIT